jgi:hypothetical protein
LQAGRWVFAHLAGPSCLQALLVDRFPFSQDAPILRYVEHHSLKDIDMDDETRKHLAFLKEQHRLSCFETGDHPDEVDTPYSKGAEAIMRMDALETRSPGGDTPDNSAPTLPRTVGMAQKYHDLANSVFHPNMINDPDDDLAFFRVCRDLMREHGISCPETPDDMEFSDPNPSWEDHPAMAFIYRAQELCVIAETGYFYHKVDGLMIPETITNSKASCFNIEDPEEDMEMEP